MEKHKCKLCFRNFSNGRALGGHMRSHMVNLPVPPKQAVEPPLMQLSFEAESASSSSSSEEEDEGEDKSLCYGLRENPKKSIRLGDPEFSFAVETGSVILQDRESETESSKNPTRRRSKRAWNQYDHRDHKHNHHHHHHHHHHHNAHKQIPEQDAFKKLKSTNKPSHTNHNNNNTESSWVEPEPVSSISDATTEEDVAFCLMMLSRDKWRRQKDQEKDQDEHEDEEEEEEEEEEEDEEEDEAERSLEDSDEFSEELKSSKTRAVRGRYKCETCKKVFRSYQALGGHRASHKKIKVAICEPDLEEENAAPMAEKKIHECPVCFRVFASGQALGGHKRTHVSHVTGSSATPLRATSTKSFGDNNLIDLNLPAPVDDDDMSQIENSAVSDAEFLKPNRQIIGAQVA